MDFDPSTRTDEGPRKRLEPGIHRMVVREAEERRSQAGNTMMRLELVTADGQHDGVRVFDNLVATPAAIWKLEQFCASCGLVQHYNRGSITERDLVGRSMDCRLTLERDTGYLRVAEYLEPEPGPEPVKAPAQSPQQRADDLPF